MADGLGSVHFARVGPRDRAPVVFLHPVGLDSTWWGAQVEAFGDDRDVVILDLPGHGLSDDLAGPPTFAILAQAVTRVLEAIGGHPAHLVGMSVGGMIAQTVALARPELVRSLTLVATLCTFPEPIRAALRERGRVARTDGMARSAELSLARWFPAAFRARRPDVCDRATRSLLHQAPAFHAAMWEMIAGLDLEAAIRAIARPTLVVAGGEDSNAPRAAAEVIARAIRGATLEVLPGVGHFPPCEAPAAFDALLRRFLDDVDGRPPRAREAAVIPPRDA